MKNGVREIAKLAKVSIGTVSNVMNRPEVVAPETVERVNAAMADLGYVAGARKKGRRVLGFGDTAQGRAIIEKVSANGLDIQALDFSDDTKREKFLRYLLDNKVAVAGILIVAQAGSLGIDFRDVLGF
jgi:DNA-binding LacI/PurR family transcriptional regulator